MNDDFLRALDEAPRPEFARALREQLRDDADAAALVRARWRPVLAFAAAAVVIVVAFAFPAVRVSAQAVLDLFRVREFTAVSFDPQRFERLHAQGGDRVFGVFDQQDVLREPGPPRAMASFAEAGAAANLDAREPRSLAGGVALDSVWVTGAGEANLVVHADRLRSVLDALELRDVEVPPGLDGRAVHVAMSPAITARYKSARRRVLFVQSRSPEVGLPAGIDPTGLGEIGLRILGLSEAEAHRLAAQIDWRNTLVVPVPVNASSFRAIQVQGHRGLLISTRATGANGPAGTARVGRDESVVLWSVNDRVYALMGSLDGPELLQMAESVR